MGFEIVIHSEQRIVKVQLTGWMDDAELLEADTQLREHPDFDPDYSQLIDMRTAEGSTVTRFGIERLTARPPLFGPNARRAIVAGNDLGFGLARMFEMNREGKAGEVQVFRNLDEAETWLAER